MNRRQRLYSIYRRIKTKRCCEEWLTDSEAFYSWYEKQAEKQSGLCAYCNLAGDTKECYGRRFREDKDGVARRGFNLEVDKKDNGGEYSPENCVLACYPCNNAKSDVFSYSEFREIGKTIEKVKGRH